MSNSIQQTDRLSMEFRFRGDINGASVPLPAADKPNWWKTCNCYQIWPASFKDSNGDGLGDIRGILSKLDYLYDLGIDVIWLSPMYDSPQEDMGYDVSDYESVYPPYGTMSDMEELIAGLHNRGMRLILDLVINHTSDQHHWFQESKKSRDNPFSDFYMWKDPKIDENGNRNPPNNWGSFFGGSAWEYVPERDQYYLHLFVPGQPDLNWESATTREAIHQSALRFWFEKGVDGFRVDTSAIYSKVQSFPDGKTGGRFGDYGDASEFCLDGPRIHEFWKEIRSEVLDDFGDPMMIGELGGLNFDKILKYVSSDERELSMIFDFDFVALGGTHSGPIHEVTGYKLPELKTAFEKVQRLVANTKAWGSVFAENHDIPRSVSRHATNDPKYHDRAAKVLAMLLTTLSGTLFMYQGQEIGMTNIPETWSIDDLRDVASINYLKELAEKHPGDKDLMRRAWLGVVAIGRDNARTPVQWSAEHEAGFTTGKPWMRVNENYTEINVADQLSRGNSILSFWKQLLKMRKDHKDVFMQGSYTIHDYENEKTFAFQKTSPGGRISFTVLNFTADECEVDLPKFEKGVTLELMTSNIEAPGKKLAPWEGRIYIQK